MEIFIAKNNQQTGPFTSEQLNSMISAGMVQITDMAWHSELPNWIPLHQILGVCPPIPIPAQPQEVVPTLPKPGGIGDISACIFFGIILFLCLLMAASSFAVATRSLGNPLERDIKLVAGPILGIVFLSLGYIILLSYRHFHRRYMGQSPQDYRGAFGTKLKPTENISGLLLVGGIFAAMVSGLQIFIVDLTTTILAAILFALSLDRSKQRKHLKRLRIKSPKCSS